MLFFLLFLCLFVLFWLLLLLPEQTSGGYVYCKQVRFNSHLIIFHNKAQISFRLLKGPPWLKNKMVKSVIMCAQREEKVL